MKKIVLAWVVCVLGLLGLFAWLGSERLKTTPATENGMTLVNGRFSLQNAEGKTVTNADFPDTYLLVFFGFTHCPDVCPTTLALMQNAVKRLDRDAKRLQPVFITVDPERDTPKIVGKYASNFGDRVVGLSGTPEQIKATADNFRVYYSKIMNDNPAMGYMMDHSAFIYLIDPNGRYVAHFSADSPEPTLVDGIRQALR